MDLIILLAVFVAFLALAYVTYRNIYNLDNRLRKIEDILKNAQVVAEPAGGEDENAQVHEQNSRQSDPVGNKVQPSPYAAGYGGDMTGQMPGQVTGWGGEGHMPAPKVTVAKEGADEPKAETRTIEVIPDDEEEDHDDDIAVDDILNEMEQDGMDADDEGSSSSDDEISIADGTTDSVPVSATNVSSAKVADLRKMLRDANVNIPNGAKKADLVKLVLDNSLTATTVAASAPSTDENSDNVDDA